jgi:hypothetical protein
MSNKQCKVTIIDYKIKTEHFTLKTTIKMLQIILNGLKKIICFIDEIQTLVIKFNECTYNDVDNISSIKEALLTAIEICYNNIKMVFNDLVSSTCIFIYTIDPFPKAGISIKYNGVSFNVNSFRLASSKEGIIKLVEYDCNLEPLSIYWIGTHLNKMNNETFNDILSKCFNNNLTTINMLKIRCLHYTHLINNLQKYYNTFP